MEEDMEEEKAEDDDLHDVEGGIRVEEKIIGGYECPTFIFSVEEEKRIQTVAARCYCQASEKKNWVQSLGESVKPDVGL